MDEIYLVKHSQKGSETKQEAVVHAIHVVDPFRVAQERATQRADLDQLVPVAARAGEA